MDADETNRRRDSAVAYRLNSWTLNISSRGESSASPAIHSPHIYHRLEVERSPFKLWRRTTDIPKKKG